MNGTIFPNLDNLTTNLILEYCFRIMFYLGAIIYIIFAFVVIRQIAVMKKTLITTFSPVISLLGYLHLGLAIGLLILYIWIL